ncbi:DUF2868 domain-containing protein [Sutterella sp.]|uniref:DUF2868 domain-containing protein n=1 Tax=Sutterella sp. TaxID=1981025 RepID=UPI0026E0C1FE|nr:DUF2868 domain-containing protein [Sutterella sp.]MDO5532517.1 DUF2868 domain-containing protein [Sutterella sp.]
MTKPADKTTTLTLPPDDAAAVLMAEMLEAEPPKGWDETQAAAVSRDARAVAGDRAEPSAYLVTRAKLLLSRMRELDPKIPQPHFPAASGLAFRLTAALIIFLGFFTGAITDQLASTGAVLNLLSPPFLGILLWNAIVIIAALILFIRPGADLVTGLSAAIARGLSTVMALPRLRLPGQNTASGFLRAAVPLLLPELSLRVRTVLHLAALAFGVGLSVSLLVRGIGTAYTAGWESTWFADRTDIIAGMLQGLYGWLPAFLPGLEPLPDAQTLAQMNLAIGSSAPGAPWLARMIWAIAAVIALPRALLAGLTWIRANQTAKRIRLPISEARLAELRAESEAVERRTFVLFSNPDLPQPDTAGAAQRVRIDPWNAPDFPELDQVTASDRVILALDPVATPEKEVHGALIEAVLGRTRHAELVLNFENLAKRFPDSPERILSRKALWEHFATEAGIPFRAEGLPKPSEPVPAGDN